MSFTPHLVPMNRGILSTIYVRGKRGRTAQDLNPFGGQRIDVEVQGRAFLLVGGARLIGRTIGHRHGDEVVVGVRIRLHGPGPVSAR